MHTKPEISESRRRWVRALVPIYLSIIFGGSLSIAIGPAAFAAGWIKLVMLLVAPISFSFVFVITAGLLSRLTRFALIEGTFPRDLGHIIYGPRRLYALCWTSIYYFTPLYHAVLAIPLLKRITFRLFGYRGALDVTVYPDTWIRDLTMLHIEPGVYLSNRATIGTNMCLQSGDVLVRPVRIGRGAIVGHLAMIGPGASLGAGVEIGVGAGIGLFSEIGRDARIGPCTTVHHYARIGDRVEVGAHCYIGLRARIANDIRIPSGVRIPERARIMTQSDVERYSTLPFEQQNRERELRGIG